MPQTRLRGKSAKLTFERTIASEIHCYKLKPFGCCYIYATRAERPMSSYSVRESVTISQNCRLVSAVESIATAARSLCLFPIGNFHAIVNELLRIA
ncbi:hypothetical protein [Chamaesiphon minutus]|nr:hypothetical protein [Chamaesiphon minutus]